MPTIRFSGTIEAKTPILITRVGQGDQPLTMIVMRDGQPMRAPVIPGETLKGLLRSLAFKIAVDARRRTDPKFTMPLEKIYEQAKGGRAFDGARNDLAFGDEGREGEPILSLFGAASPPIRGRLIVEPAIASGFSADAFGCDMDLPEGVRRDPLLADPAIAGLLSPDDQERWVRQSGMVRRGASKGRALEDARRALNRARKTPGLDAAPFEAKVASATAELERLKEEEDYTVAMQRPLPAKHATPAGTVFDHKMEIRDASPIEIGLFLKTLRAWSLDPRIGGGRTTGYGRVDANYSLDMLTPAESLEESRWSKIGSLRICDSGMALDADDSTLRDAREAWTRAEENIASAWAPA